MDIPTAYAAVARPLVKALPRLHRKGFDIFTALLLHVYASFIVLGILKSDCGISLFVACTSSVPIHREYVPCVPQG